MKVKLALSFAAGMLLVFVSLALLPVPARVRYDALDDDAVRIKLVHERIVTNPKPIDIAFIGTSHTEGGVRDGEVERLLANSGLQLSAANLAVTWMGRDLHLLIAKELLEHKKPRLIVIEVSEFEYAFGHKLMPYVGELPDIFCCDFYLDPAFPKNFSIYLKWQALHTMERVSGATPAPKSSRTSFGDHGWVPFDGTWRPDGPSTTRPASLMRRLNGLAHANSSAYGLNVVRQIVALAHSHGVAVAFLYLPAYEYATAPPLVDSSNYLVYGPMWKMPAQLSADTDYWFDSSHLNISGSKVLAPSLAADLSGMFKRDVEKISLR